MKNTQSELTIKEAKEALEFLKKEEGKFTKEGKTRTEQLKQFLKK